MTENNRIHILFGRGDAKGQAAASTASGHQTPSSEPSGARGKRCLAPQDAHARGLLYRQIREKLLAEFPQAKFTRQMEIDGLAQDYLCLADYRRMREELARPRLTLTWDEERKLKICQESERIWPAVKRVMQQKELPIQPVCTPEEARDVAIEIGHTIKLTRMCVYDDDEADPEQAPQIGQAEAGDAASAAPAPATSSSNQKKEYAYDPDPECVAFLASLGDLQNKLRDCGFVVKLLSGGQTPTAQEWGAIQAVLEFGKERLLNEAEPDESLRVALKNIERAAAAVLIANADKLLMLDNQTRKMEEVIARNLRRLRKV